MYKLYPEFLTSGRRLRAVILNQVDVLRPPSPFLCTPFITHAKYFTFLSRHRHGLEIVRNHTYHRYSIASSNDILGSNECEIIY